MFLFFQSFSASDVLIDVLNMISHDKKKIWPDYYHFDVLINHVLINKKNVYAEVELQGLIFYS